MKLSLSILTTTAAAAFALAGCSNDPGPANMPVSSRPQPQSYDPSSLAAGGNTQHHFQDPNTGQNGITEPAVAFEQAAAVGSPQVVAELHSCGKIPYASLGSILATRGVDIQPSQTGDTSTAGTLYAQGAAALGVADYSGRVPEMVIASMSAMAKEFDVFVAAAAEIQANLASSSACSGASIADASGHFSINGISCIMGKPATADHVTLADQIVQSAPDINTGVRLAIAAILEAAHTCE